MTATRFKTRNDAEAEIDRHALPSFAAAVWVSPLEARATGAVSGWYVSVLRDLIDFDTRTVEGAAC